MAQLDPRLILAGNTPDLMGAFDQGQQAGARTNAIQQQNRLAQVFQSQGAGIAAGDQNALNALAAIDPIASLGVQQTRLGMDATRQGMRIDEQNVSLRAQELAASLDQATRTRAGEQFTMGANMIATAQTPEQFQAIVSRPGFVESAGILGITPEMLTFENRDALAAAAIGAADVMKLRGGGSDSAKEQEIQRTMRAWGVDYATAQGIADGVLKVSQDPTTREIMITNLATRETFAPSISQGTQAQQPGTVQQPPAQPAPAGNPTFGDAFQGAQNSFGFQGVLRGIANTAADATGFEVPFPEDQQTRQDFAVLGESLINDFASAYGRQPPSWLLENIARLVPQAGRPFEGPQQAQTKLTAIARDMISRREAAQAQLSRRLTPAERQEALALIAGIDATLVRVDAALKGFQRGNGQGGNQTSKGVTWSIEE